MIIRLKNLNPALYLHQVLLIQVGFMKQTPLYQQHYQANAQMVDFFGWSLPMHYGSQLSEHHKVRQHVGMFDVSHMAIVELVGEQSQTLLRYLLANDVAKMKQPGRAQYTLMLNHQGGVLDDLIVFFCQSDRYRLIFNAANAERNIAWVQDISSAFNVSVQALTDYANVAIQGPEAEAVTQKLVPELAQSLSTLKPFRFIESQGWLISRTGYTGEDGFEVMLPSESASSFWHALQQAGVQPCGLGARDTLRLEAGLNLYGQDMDESTLPIEANLDWVVSWKDSQRDFIGRQALQHQQSQTYKRLIGVFLTQRGVLRSGQFAIDGDDIIGQVTSGTFSPTIQRGIGLIRTENPLESGEVLAIKYRQRTLKGQVVKPPFVRQGEILIPALKE